MNLTGRHVEICRALHQRHIDLARGEDEERRKLTGMIAEQWCFEFGKDWGTKARSPTAPRSKDALAHRTGPSSMDVWDWQNGTTREPSVREGQPPDYPNITDQFFLEVAPVNHLGVAPDDGGTVVPKPHDVVLPQVDATLIEVLKIQHKERLKELRGIREQLRAIAEAIRKLGSAPGPGGSQ